MPLSSLNVKWVQLKLHKGMDEMMYKMERTFGFMRGFLKSYGPSSVKRRLWDEEFSGGKWNFIDETLGDCVYAYLEKYGKQGSILDLGCGPGNTANELSAAAYKKYVGIDVSEAALAKARKRSSDNRRAEQNEFAQGDFLKYVPNQEFDVILFRESMYHVPVGKIKFVLDRFAKYLRPGGVFIVRMNTTGGKLGRPKAMADIMEAEFDVLEKRQFGESGPTVLVFRAPKSRN
jgi:SAM-dependent methyltransferase